MNRSHEICSSGRADEETTFAEKSGMYATSCKNNCFRSPTASQTFTSFDFHGCSIDQNVLGGADELDKSTTIVADVDLTSCNDHPAIQELVSSVSKRRKVPDASMGLRGIGCSSSHLIWRLDSLLLTRLLFLLVSWTKVPRLRSLLSLFVNSWGWSSLRRNSTVSFPRIR